MYTTVEIPFGQMPDGTRINSYTLMNGNGIECSVINYGATITSLHVPLSNGETDDVVLGFDNIEAYLKSIDLQAPPYFGAIIGRWAGRIKNGLFKLKGVIYQLEKNNGGHSLHGGRLGFSQRVWEVKSLYTEENPSITFSYLSPNGDENFPGGLNVEATYSLTEENELIVDFWAQALEDTIVNLTQHSYFNLEGHKSNIRNQQLSVNAQKILETEGMIPTGNFLNVRDTPFDFSSPRKCPDHIDTTFVLTKEAEPAAVLLNPTRKIRMNVFTDQPAVHIYVGGDCFNIIKGKENTNYHSLSGICFETQNFPDAPNHPNFPNPVLKKGEEYRRRTIYQFINDEEAS